MYDSPKHTRFPKEDHLTDRACRDNKVTQGDRVEKGHRHLTSRHIYGSAKYA